MTQAMGLGNKLPALTGYRELRQEEDDDDSSSLGSSVSGTAVFSAAKERPLSSSPPADHEDSEPEMAPSLAPGPLKRKRGRPPKKKMVKQPSNRKAQFSAGPTKLHIKKSETKALEASSPRNKESRETDCLLEKRKRGRPPKGTPSAESPRKRGRPPKGTPSAESPRKRGRPPKGTPSAESPRKRGRPPKGTPSAESPRKRGRPPKGTPSAESPRKRGRPPKGTPSAESPRKRGRPPKGTPSAESPRKRGRPPKIKSLEQLNQGEAQSPSSIPKSPIRKLETKAPELSCSESETESSESNSPIKKRKQGRPHTVPYAQVTLSTDLPCKQHRPSKNKSSEINKGDMQPPPGTPKSNVMKLETKMPEPSSPRSRTTERLGEGEAQSSPSTPKPRAQKPGTSASEPTSSRSKTVSSENGSPLEKRRRGRPPKVPGVPASSSAESPRKRGRPPKNPASPRMEVAVVCPGSASDRDTSAENEPPLPGRKRRRRSRKEEPVLAVSESSLDSEDWVALLPPQNAIPEAEPDGTSLGESSSSEHPPARSTRSMGAINSSKTGPISGSLRM